MPWGEQTYLRFFPNLTWQSDPQIETVARMAAPGTRMLDLGAGGRRIAPDVIAVDFMPWRGTNLVADVQALPIRDDAIGVVFATGLLEHVDDDRQVLTEINRILGQGGLAHVEVPFLQQYHEDPIDCRRFTAKGLAREMERAGLRTVSAGCHIGPTVTMITLAAYYAALLFEGRGLLGRMISTGVFLVTSALLYPFKFLDRLLLRKRSAHRLAFGVYCTARKA